MIGVVANPAAGRGKAARILDSLETEFDRIGWSVTRTTAAGSEAQAAAKYLEQGIDTIVAIGGDGTCSNIVKSILARQSGAALSVIPCGTGNDFAKTLGLLKCTPSEIVALLQTERPRHIDVGRADGNYFINSCGFGFDSSVLQASARVKWLRGNAVYIYSAVKQLFAYRGVNVSVNEMPRGSGKLLMAIVSNGQWLGGAFHIAPRASVIDGLLDVALFGNCGVVERAQLFIGATRGTHLRSESVRHTQSASLTLRFESPPAMEVDGELVYAQSNRVAIECLPRALNVIAAPGAIRSRRTAD